MITIHLYNLVFYAYHGVYQEERLLGNEFEVNADVQFQEEDSAITTIFQTINYASVYEIIKERMQTPTPLLETIVLDIGRTIYEKYNYVRHIHISLKKKHPPVEGLLGEVGVSWHKDF